MHRCLAVQRHILYSPCLTCSPAGGSSFGWGTQASTFLSGRIFKYKFSFRQFFILIPHYIPGFNPATNPFFVFGESYGGPHVLQLAVGSGWCWCWKCGDDDGVRIFMLMAYKLEEIKYCLESFQLGFNHLCTVSQQQFQPRLQITQDFIFDKLICYSYVQEYVIE